MRLKVSAAAHCWCLLLGDVDLAISQQVMMEMVFAVLPPLSSPASQLLPGRDRAASVLVAFLLLVQTCEGRLDRPFLLWLW